MNHDRDEIHEAVEVEPVTAAEVMRQIVARLIEVEQREIALERRFLEQAGEIRTLASALKVQQDALQEKHTLDQQAFLQIADSLARLTLERTSKPTGSEEVN